MEQHHDLDQVAKAIQMLWREKRDAMVKAGPRSASGISYACNAYVNAIGRVVAGVSGTYFDGEDWLKAHGETGPFQ